MASGGEAGQVREERDYLSDDEGDVALRAAMRLYAFLEREVDEELPASSATAVRYRQELDRLLPLMRLAEPH